MPSINKPNIMIIAGEASGDQRGGEVAEQLRQLCPNAKLSGIGGKDMRTAGVDCLFDVNDLAVMGFIEPIKHLPKILRIFKAIKQHFVTDKPDLIILVDYPGFNLRLAKAAKQAGIKVLFYVSPQVWAWRQGRVKKIAKVVDHMAVIFPFEEKFYQQHHVPVTYVGHPLSEKIKEAPSQTEARKQLKLAATDTVISLMPGSRHSEVEKLLPIMLAAIQKIISHHPQLKIVLPLASTIDKSLIKNFSTSCSVPIIFSENSLLTTAAANVVVTASGTATLETALLNKPMIIVYKVSRLSAAIAKRVIKIPFISLCNIVAGKGIVKEFLQDEATPENISLELLKILDDRAYHSQMLTELQQINRIVGNHQAAENVAKIALEMIESY